MPPSNRSRPTSPSSSTPAEASRERSDWRLGPAAVLAWSIAGVSYSVDESAAWLTSGAAAVAILLIAGAAVVQRRGSSRCAGWLRLVAVSAAVAALTGWASWHALEQRQAAPMQEAIASKHSCLVEFTLTQMVSSSVLEDPGSQEDGGQAPLGQRFRAQLTHLDCGTGAFRLDAPVLVSGRLAAGSSTEPGTRFAADAKLRDIQASSRSAARLSLDAPAEQLAPPGGALAVGATLRASFLTLAATLPGDGGQLVPGLAVGDDREVAEDLVAAMKTSSLVHLTAVSGANCALVTGAVLVIGRLLMRPRLERLAAASLALVAFVVLVTPQGSVVRASAMAIVVLAADAGGRRVTGSSALNLAVIGLLVISPDMSLDAGFALSAAATAGLLLGAGPLGERLSAWMPRPLALTIAVPVAAQLLCQPVLVLLDPRVPVHGVTANLLAAPAAPIATVVGLLACLLAPLAPPLAVVLAWVAWLPASWIAAVARVTSGWPLASIPVPEGLGGVLITAIPAVLLVWWCRERGDSPPARLRRLALVALMALLVTVALGVGLGQRVGSGLTRPDPWRYWMCDVGQGDAMLIRSTAGVILMDTGPESEALDACLTEAKVSELAALILTHFDKDHDGAAATALPLAEQLIVPATGEAHGEGIVRDAATHGIPLVFAGRGDVFTFGDLALHVLWPARTSSGQPSVLSSNDGSLAVSVKPTASCRQACVSLIALADLGEAQQNELMSEAPPELLSADVVKVSHHGSRDQAAELYRVMQPKAALVSVGAENGYGHPTRSTLDMLTAAGAIPLRTDERGHLVVAGSPDDITVWSPPQALAEAASVPRFSASGWPASPPCDTALPECAPPRSASRSRRSRTP